MPATNLSFAKIVATPSTTSWSQAYNAGSLFIVLSLSSDDETLQEQLPTMGKQVLDNIQAEFFGLEAKTFETIKKAIQQSLIDLDETISLSLSLTFCKEDALYAFVVGTGRITLKRGDKMGIILEDLESSSRDIKSSSGYLQSNDLILIQTSLFASTVPAKTIIEAFDNTLPNDIAETISPSVHGTSEGGASAIVLSYKGISHNVEEETTEPEITHNTPVEDEIISRTESVSEAKRDVESESEVPSFPINQPPNLSENRPTRPFSNFSSQREENYDDEPSGPSLITRLTSSLPHLPSGRMPRQKKLTLGIICLLIGLLVVSIFVVQKHSQSSKDHELFVQIYDSAKKDYDEGEGLLSLNKSLALDDYKSAKTTLDGAQDKFKDGSNEKQQLSELSTKVNKRLDELSGSSSPSISEAESSDVPVLKALLDEPSLLGATEEDNKVYTLSSKTIESDGKTIVTNDDNWDKARSLGTFSGNFYVLDPQKGLIKFVPAGGGYAASIYFKGDAPDLKNAVSMTIDSSIYILFGDGAIQKYTRGTKDSFDTSSVKKAFSSPTAIFTSADLQNVYVLDNGNSRIVKIDKSGIFVSEYSSDKLKSAKAITISKDEKTAYILSSNKVYQLSL